MEEKITKVAFMQDELCIIIVAYMELLRDPIPCPFPPFFFSPLTLLTIPPLIDCLLAHLNHLLALTLTACIISSCNSRGGGGGGDGRLSLLPPPPFILIGAKSETGHTMINCTASCTTIHFSMKNSTIYIYTINVYH